MNLAENIIFPFNEGQGDKTEIDILSFKSLPNGWDFGEGVAAKEFVTKMAIKLYLKGKFYGFHVTAHPMTDGGIVLVFFIKGTDHFLDVIIAPNLRLDIKYEIGKGSSFLAVDEWERVGINFIDKKLLEIKAQCSTSDFLTSVNTIQKKKGSTVTPLSYIKGEYHSYSRNALNKKQYQFAATSQNTMLPQLESRSYIGLSKKATSKAIHSLV